MKKKTAPEYLPMKTVAIVAIIISLGFHVIMMLSFFFGNTLFSSEIVNLYPHHFNIWRFLYFTTTSYIIVFLILIYNRRILSFSYKNKKSIK